MSARLGDPRRIEALRIAQRKGAVRTAIVLASIAAAFFFGVIVKFYLMR